MTFVKENSPHILRKSSVARMMLDVLIALLPVVVYSIIIYKLNAVIILVISIAVMLLSEFVFVGIKNKMPYDGKKHTFKEKWNFAYSKYSINNVLTPLISAVIFSMILPASVANKPYAIIVGALLGIILGKLLFGGLGSNIFNPAAVGMVIVKLCFGSAITYSSDPFFDVKTGGTILTSINIADGGSFLNLSSSPYSVLDLFLGRCPGTLGEISALLIIIGGIYLLIRRSADFRIMLSYFATFLFLILVSGLCICGKLGFDKVNYAQFIGTELFSGGVIFGGVFMLTDPVTSPINRPGRYMYGMIAAVCTVFIRLFAALPEGVVFSILIANMFSPVIDYYKWSSNSFTKKKILAMSLIVGIALAILIIVLLSPGVVK